MKVLQINSSVNSGSTGRIAEEIGNTLLNEGHQSVIAYGRAGMPSASQSIRIGGQLDIIEHVLLTKLFDRHGFGSKRATKAFVHSLDEVDIVHLHNIHGYYLHVGELFGWLKETQKPVIWTLHDCWAFTGHCTFFDSVGCEKWQTECHHCPKTKFYPASLGVDNSRSNYQVKKALFSGVRNMTIVTPSKWLQLHLKHSFLRDYPSQVIPNGIDVELFSPKDAKVLRNKLGTANKKVILGVASTWDKRKGLADFKSLGKTLDSSWQIILVGLSKKDAGDLPSDILAIPRTESVSELATYYSLADVFVNPTWQDNFPTTNLEALACGTPVITYRTGGSPEAVDNQTGRVVEKGDIDALKSAINEVLATGKVDFSANCVKSARALFNKKDRFTDYVKLYNNIVCE
ncbi:glycosyltransferase [Imperialibacter roseus]|uniref:Glycosyltransferase n=1 Tax=Imperialibacter roseus TaxID=1324217 RepID=A0ABZ0IN10_9BACT|nr:glycosyltransferase [Imperialibacter roseus]WOK05365.1 glycosyltransferase [Imperialibacter roseus]